MTDGGAGHHTLCGEALARLRAEEAEEAAKRLGIDSSEVLANHDTQLTAAIEARWEVVRQIRNWQADVVLTHRPYDYHPDHRYTAQLVQDSAYLVVIPNVCAGTTPLKHNPVFFYLEDCFQKPAPFVPDIAVDVSDVWEQKVAALDAHASQFYEWLPWVDGRADQVPEDPLERRQWLSACWSRPPCGATRAALLRRYGAGHCRQIQHAEAFELCEYGRRPSAAELGGMFPR